MTYYSKKEYKLLGYQKATNTKKKYQAILERNKDKKIIKVPFGAVGYENFRDLTGLNLYKTHGDIKRRKLYRGRHKKDLKVGYYSPGLNYFNKVKIIRL
jgi:hypothetical protein